MEIAFETIQLRQICESENRAKRILGEEIAAKLKSRLGDLRAMPNAAELLNVPYPLSLNDKEHILITLRNDYVMILCASHINNPLSNNGKIDWSKVTRVKVLEIGVSNG